jgi:NDP-sugar pyrophosphorylase family protein
MTPPEGAILVAGEGRRLRAVGGAVVKPLVPVAGVPLLAAAIENFRAAGIESMVIIVNEQGRGCASWARARFPALDLRFIVQTTASSLESFRLVLAASRGPRVLVSTVDAWCRPADFAAFATAAGRRPADAIVLGVTPLCADEKPLWVSLGPDGRVTALGGARGELVTAGLYLVPDRVRAAPPPPRLSRLRDYLGWLWRRGEALYGEIVPDVVDVDRPDDVALAEAIGRAGPAAPAAGPAHRRAEPPGVMT